MIRRVIGIPGGVAHYVVGSAYVMAHLLLHQHRARELELA